MLARPDPPTAPARMRFRGSRVLIMILAAFLTLAALDGYVLWVVLRGY